jgi:hypothetical protein
MGQAPIVLIGASPIFRGCEWTGIDRPDRSHSHFPAPVTV